ncbi:hypothetical protein F5B22DRAFT_482113 [Xylaria bambusicola]|uniref:uncharacterized protein n=1 Tax=Xylaria bambusicola TaxID=326684 RepID=UPI002007B884|nr:uncharacterized protein F5B22DRAFT_482113 [Xylaria bambusicola]KAI0506054.1 hypothetical protein F5B22DRAFT_482113 [Xylaria bambusicola]
MSYKRNRAQFEADLQAQQSPYVLFGTPLPPLDPEVRDDGSYVPVWKQEVRDERGRKRLHGAFTGGWSAGYFNTVGSKEGWTPSTFVSSRSNRHKDEQKTSQQRIEDFMDEEDLADAADAEKLQTAQGFAGLGSTEEDGIGRGGLAGLFRVQGETMGVKLLRKMGWKDGQGIGPKVRRKARLDIANKPNAPQSAGETYLFAPENVSMIAFIKKKDRKGLGFEGESRLTPLRNASKPEAGESSDEESLGLPLRRPGLSKKEKNKFGKGGIGIGILNDTGSDDEDPYEIGPKISYNRVIGGDKKKKKIGTTTANPALGAVPVFRSRKNILARVSKGLRKCHDGRLPLEGFLFGTEADPLTSSLDSDKYPPPEIPPGWKSSKERKAEGEKADYISTADAAKSSKLDPKSRAALLGEAQLPGKSVFDFLSAEARERLASATGKTNLPPALGEVPAEFALTEAEKQQELLRQLPELDKVTAVAALTRGASGTGPAPYADDEAKRGRYRTYLEYAAGFNKTIPSKPPNMKTQDWMRELHEFVSCARIFKPMTGLMASRFTTSTAKPTAGAAGGGKGEDLLHKPPEKPKDPAEEAARLGMYGSMTRTITDFYPTRLLCKRFNVRPPAHVQPDAETETSSTRPTAAASGMGTTGVYSEGAVTLDELMRQAQAAASLENNNHSSTTASRNTNAGISDNRGLLLAHRPEPAQTQQAQPVEVNADVNDALEGKRAQEEVLKAIFGDSSDEEDD